VGVFLNACVNQGEIMTRSLEGKVFFASTNNGVTALASERVVNEKLQRTQIRDALIKPHVGKASGLDVGKAIDEGLRLATGPIFTFVNDERYAKSPWFSGRMWMFEKLLVYIEAEGGVIMGNGYVYVPFSNGIEIRYPEPERMRTELEYVTTTQDFINEFGLTRGEIMGKYL
jgi:hypothetical protein